MKGRETSQQVRGKLKTQQIMQRIICLIIVAYWANLAQAQSKVEKLVPVQAGQTVNMDFKWPELITIRTWDKNEVKLVASVDINKGQNDDAFVFEVNETSSGVTIASHIKNFKSLPRKILIKKDGQEYFFNTDDHSSPEIQKFRNEYGNDGYDYMNVGVIMDITVEIWLPSNANLDVYSKFGLVEVLGFGGKMLIHSKFGGVDVSSSGKPAIKAGTKFGEKYTNLTGEIKTISLGSHPGSWDWVLLGSGTAKQEVKSDFGNVYLRKL